ncbi:MAG: hypothetical protein CMF48_03035 [Legionellales bacterium]|nr:hypothetical protein [Legionellales bacterium]
MTKWIHRLRGLFFEQIYLLIFVLLSMTVSVFTLSDFAQPLKVFFPSFLWMTLSLFTLFQASTVFKREHTYGVVDQWVLTKGGLEKNVNRLILVLSLSGSLVFILTAPMIALMYELTSLESLYSLLFIIVTVPTLSIFSMLGGCLTLKASSNQLIIPILLLPLLVPIIIFGSLGSAAYMAGDSPLNYLYVLLGMLILAKTMLTPLICKALFYANG